MTNSIVLPPINPMDMHTPMSRAEAHEVLRVILYDVIEDGLDHFAPLEGFRAGLPTLDVSSGTAEDGVCWHRVHLHDDPEISAVLHRPGVHDECWHPRLYRAESRGGPQECFHVEIAGYRFDPERELFTASNQRLFGGFLRNRVEQHIHEAEESGVLSV